jgi:hypothetical protein
VTTRIRKKPWMGWKIIDLDKSWQVKWPIEIDGLPSYKMVIFNGYVK